MAAVCPVLVGRVRETAELAARLRDAESGRGGAVVITGPAGIGKSRLLAATLDDARARGDRVLVGRALPEAVGVPFRALADALLGVDAPAEVSVQPWATLLAGVLPSATLQRGDPGAHAVSTEATSLARAEALLRLFRSLSGKQPLVVGLEDLQWADPDTLAVVEQLTAHLEDEPVLLVATVRHDGRSDDARVVVDRLLAGGTRAEIRLDRLTAEEVTVMVSACGAPDDAALVERVTALSEGVPFLVEEFLASSGRTPRSFTEMVRGRLDGLDEGALRVVRTAALLGRTVDEQLAGRVAGLDRSDVARALEDGERLGLLDDVEGVHTFRHALTREAIVDHTPPALRSELALAVLAALESDRNEPTVAGVELMAELARIAGDHDRAAALRTEAGRLAFERGALSTAAEILRRATAPGVDPSLRVRALGLLVDVYAAAGRVEECLAAGRTILDLPHLTIAERAATHVSLAQACVEADRWSLASTHLVSAAALLESHPDPTLDARHRVLDAEVALAARDLRTCGARVADVLSRPDVDAEVRCHALALSGRSLRVHDLDAAGAAFADCLTCAVTAALPLWQLKALHELGTVDLFDHAGKERLEEALRTAESVGALSTLAVLHLQLAAAHIFRFEHEAAISHALQARDSARRLGMSQVAATAAVFIAEVAAVSDDPTAMVDAIADAEATLPGDPEITGSAWGARALARLFQGDRAGAVEPLRRSFEILTRLPNPGPALYLGFWPLLLAVDDDGSTEAASAAARAAGITVNRANRGLLALAEAVRLGRTDPDGAASLAGEATSDLAAYPVWADLARLLVAPSARRDGWGDWRGWLESATASFDRHGLVELAGEARDVGRHGTGLAATLGITLRETEVLRLVGAGLSNKEIAAHLVLSSRTVEKHLEGLFRKTGTRSRTELLASRVGREVAYRAT